LACALGAFDPAQVIAQLLDTMKRGAFTGLQQPELLLEGVLLCTQGVDVERVLAKRHQGKARVTG
jgi:hypothetical protein